jgi:hypothetical protein
MTSDVNGLDYEGDVPTESGYYDEDADEQRYFDMHRARVYAFWQARAAYEQRRAERVDSHRVTEELT